MIAINRVSLAVLVGAGLMGACAVHDPVSGEMHKDLGADTTLKTSSNPPPMLAKPYTTLTPSEPRLDMYFPQSLASGTSPKGVVIFVHGGGWDNLACDGVAAREDVLGFMFIASRLPSFGWIVASIDYRNAGWNNNAPTNPFPAQIYDVKHAIRFVKKWIADNGTGQPYNYNISNFKYVGMGHSAGGQLISLAGMTASANPPAWEPPFLPNTEVSTLTSQLDAVVNLAGPLDMQHWVKSVYSVLEPASVDPAAPCSDGQKTGLDQVSEFLGCSLKGSNYPPSASFKACCRNNTDPLCYPPQSGEPALYVPDDQIPGAPDNTVDIFSSTAVQNFVNGTASPAFYVAHSTEDSLVLSGGPTAAGQLGPTSSSCSTGTAYVQNGRHKDFWVDYIEQGDNDPSTSNEWLLAAAHVVWDMNVTGAYGLREFLNSVATSGSDLPTPAERNHPTVNLPDEERLCGWPDNDAVKINEVSPTGDWIELINTGRTPIDLAFFTPFSVSNGNQSWTHTITSTTTLAPGGLHVVTGAQLGNNADSVVLRQGTTVMDQVSWSSSVTGSLARCPTDPPFVPVNPPTQGAANTCP